jgi:oligoendopeptidase F
MKLRMYCAALACAAAAAGAQPVAPADAAKVWDLTPLYASDAAWDADRRDFAADLPRLRALQGRLGRDAASLREVLGEVSKANRKMQRLWVYASTQLSTDARSQRNQERSALMGTLWAQYSSAVAFVDPEIQALGADKAEGFLRAEPGLAPHARRIRNALRQARHTLSPEAEEALAALAQVTAAPTTARTLLIDTDAEWPTLEVGGKVMRLNETGYHELREHPDRAVRKRAFDAFWAAYGRYENTLGALLATRVQAGVAQARLRRHASAAAAALDASEVPESVLRTVVAEANRGLPTLHRYFALRRRLLKLPDLHYYDVYPELVSSSRRYPVAEAAEITLAAVKPLGDEYQALLARALAARTMHAQPAPGKRTGAYATSVYGFTPYVFLNHRDTYESLVTFAHEWGHGMHSVLAQRSQPFETAGYTPFTAEIASITNEVLLAQHMLEGSRTRDEKLFVLGEALERVRASFFRQAMFAEFELAAHDAQQRGEPLSGKRFTEMYCALLRKYHGADQGVVAIDPAYCREWAFIPHFHRPFYVYAYAAATAAAHHFGSQLLDGVPGARENYLGVLRAGGSLPPHEMLLRSGLDLTSTAPHEALMQRMNALMDQIEALLAAPA